MCRDDIGLGFDKRVSAESASRPVKVSVTFLNSSGRVIRSWEGERRYEKFYPNGEGCGDPCFRITVNFPA
jgi:hypothetical protein